MITTNVITLLVTAKNTNEKVIINIQTESLKQLAEKMRNGYQIDKILEFQWGKHNFVRVNKNLIKSWTDHCTEFATEAEKQNIY